MTVHAGWETIVRTFVPDDYKVIEIGGDFNNQTFGMLQIDLSNYDIDLTYLFSSKPFKLLTRTKSTGEWSVDFLSIYGNAYTYNNETGIIELDTSVCNLGNSKDLFKLYFYGKQKGSIVLKGHSFNLNKEQGILNVTCFGDNFEKNVSGSKKVELTIEAFEVQDFILNSIVDGTIVNLEILPYSGSTARETFIGYVSKIENKSEANGVQTMTFEFKSA